MKENYELRLVPKGSVIVTPPELEALNKYSEKARLETIKATFAAVKELLKDAECVETRKFANTGDSIHSYGAKLCETLLADLLKIETKYME